jgi:hypothetical protein
VQYLWVVYCIYSRISLIVYLADYGLDYSATKKLITEPDA